jgi:hypothetical protein
MSNPRKTAFRSIKHPDEQSTVEMARENGAERATEALRPVMWTPLYNYKYPPAVRQ